MITMADVAQGLLFQLQDMKTDGDKKFVSIGTQGKVAFGFSYISLEEYEKIQLSNTVGDYPIPGPFVKLTASGDEAMPLRLAFLTLESRAGAGVYGCDYVADDENIELMAEHIAEFLLFGRIPQSNEPEVPPTFH